MQPEPPQFINPLRLAGQGAQISGCLRVGQLTRLKEVVLDEHDEIEYSLKFGRDAAGVHCIIGSLDAIVSMPCQRCLQPVVLELCGEIRLGIVQGEEQARRLDPEFEPLLVEQEKLRLAEMVEDEVLLLLPIAPMHDEPECAGYAAEVAEATIETEKNTRKPFAELKHLRRRK